MKITTETDPAVLGIQMCGCITFAYGGPLEELTRDDQDSLLRIVMRGGLVETTTVEEARKREHFLVSECPHRPKGWGL